MKDQTKKSVGEKISYWTGVIVIGVLVGLSLQLARAAWSEPGSTAPGGNVAAPLNISGIDQTKSGSLQLNGLALTKTDKALLIPNGNIGVGTVNPNPAKGLAGYVTARDVYLSNIGQWASALGGGGLSGSGTANYVSKWTGGTALGNSQVFDNGSNVGIGTASPAQKLDVNGSIRMGATSAIIRGAETGATVDVFVNSYCVGFVKSEVFISVRGGIITGTFENVIVDGCASP